MNTFKLSIEDLFGECESSFAFDPIDIEDITYYKEGFFTYALTIFLKDGRYIKVNNCNKYTCNRLINELMQLREIRRLESNASSYKDEPPMAVYE